MKIFSHNMLLVKAPETNTIVTYLFSDIRNEGYKCYIRRFQMFLSTIPQMR